MFFLGQCGFLYGDSSQQTWWKLKWWSICNQVLVPFGSNPALFGDVGALSRSRLDFRESGTLGFGSWFTVKSPICCITRVPKFERKRMKEREREKKKRKEWKKRRYFWLLKQFEHVWAVRFEDVDTMSGWWPHQPDQPAVGRMFNRWALQPMDQDQYIPKLARSS